MKTGLFLKKLGLPLIILVIALIALSLFLAGFKPTIPGLKPAPDKTFLELKAIAEASPLVQNYAGITPTYRKLPNEPTSNVYVVDYFDAKANSGISLMIDLNEKKIIKTQVVVGVGGP